MRRSRKIWLGVGAFILTGEPAVNANELQRFVVEGKSDGKTSLPPHNAAQLRTDLANVWAQAGEGGEGGEGGINPETVGNDPAEYAIALQIIAAHFDAGIAAYAGGEREAGAQMFAHGLSEIYAVMEDTFKQRGVTTLGPKLEAAVEAAADKKPLKEVRSRFNDVLLALRDAARRGPQPASPKRMQAFVVGELIERAAAQYSVAQKDKGLEAYLDGLGFAIAARREAKPALESLRSSDKQAAATLANALQLLQRAYPGLKRPTKGDVSEADLLAAASRSRLAVSAYR
ncbi:hypothetical protein [Bradyrhizobium sp. LHD-71]|uniref:hypothetical protein n=1 Tax=Bradyrhizobium sp. LHD-71 TaxID=3072141 RepID=UPI00280C5B2F|nr:hypothetical protein [Bradyrhizobium sp. LHD-71]MDQ8730791.1 hypothetical protein [Bradyrhizobium sp. LHD-71]